MSMMSEHTDTAAAMLASMDALHQADQRTMAAMVATMGPTTLQAGKDQSATMRATLLGTLAVQGWSTRVIGTGGGCTAYLVSGPGARTLLITGSDADLPLGPDLHQDDEGADVVLFDGGWCVGLYGDQDASGEPIATLAGAGSDPVDQDGAARTVLAIASAALTLGGAL